MRHYLSIVLCMSKDDYYKNRCLTCVLNDSKYRILKLLNWLGKFKKHTHTTGSRLKV